MTFTEWMNKEYGDDWPTNDDGLQVWFQYLEYVRELIESEK